MTFLHQTKSALLLLRLLNPMASLLRSMDIFLKTRTLNGSILAGPPGLGQEALLRQMQMRVC